MKVHAEAAILLIVVALLSVASSFAQSVPKPFAITPNGDLDNIVPIRSQVLAEEGWLRWRREHIVPEVMRRVGVDLWLVDDSDGALYYSLVPASHDGLVSRAHAVLMFHDRGNAGVEALTIDLGDIESAIRERAPRRIGVSEATREDLASVLGGDLVARFVVCDDLRRGFLEKRSPEEISVFQHVARVAYAIIAEAFSNRVVVPDVTTTDDLNWWIRQRYRDLGLETSDHPTITIQRSRLERPKYIEDDEHFRIDISPRNGYNTVIRRGDVLGVDTGIIYFGLGTDTQQVAYVLKAGESEVPQGLEKALDNTNRLQIHLRNAFAVGKPANDIVNDALEAAWADGLRPSIYGHPLPYQLLRYSTGGAFIKLRYSAGPELGGDELVEPAPLRVPGGYPVYANTTYAMELHTWTSVPEWGGQDVRIVLEQNVAMTESELVFLGGRQTEWHVIR